MNNNLLAWARQLQAISQNGLNYAVNDYDRERYTHIQRIAAEMMATSDPTMSPINLAAFFHRETGHATPKVDVRAGVFRDDRILLVREISDGGWTLPGGWADVGDAPSLAAARETREESGYEVKITKLVAAYDRNQHPHPPIPYHAYKLFFLGEVIGGAPATSNETDAVDFFAEDRLPALSLSRILPEQIALMFRHHRDPALPAEFD
ncbi:MAG TPA: NUDIX hydrolase [Terriglobales bacterium]|nr:NUDIX hydrolase [Terriglobales bacterium]